MTKKLSLMPYAQACVLIEDDGTIYLISYRTYVCKISPDGRVECMGLYSMTTRKHISAFMREYTPFDYETAKKLYENDETINIFTGEIEKMVEV